MKKGKEVSETEKQQRSPADTTRKSKYFLSLKQRRAIPALLSAPTMSEGARRAGVSRSQLNRWFKDPYFVEEFECQSEECVSTSIASLKGKAMDAVKAWDDCLRSQDDRVKFMAAKTFFEVITNLPERHGAALNKGTDFLDAKFEGYFLDREQAMMETAELNLHSSYRVVSKREPLLWQRILFGNLNRAEWFNLFEEAGAMDILGFQEAAFLCLGSIASVFHPDIKKLYNKYVQTYSSHKSDKDVLKLNNQLKQKLRSFDLPPSEKIDPFLDILRKSTQDHLGETISLFFLYEEEGHGLWKNLDFEYNAGPEPSSPHGPEDKDAQNGNDHDTSEKPDDQVLDMNISSGAETDQAQAAPEGPRLKRRRVIGRTESEGTFPRKDEEGY